MSSTTDQTRVAAVKETTAGTTPTGGTWEILRLNSESLTRTANNVDSGEMNAQRGLSDVIQAGANVAGDLSSYVVYNGSYIEMILGVLGATTAWPSSANMTGATAPSDIISTWSLEKAFLNADGRYSYLLYKGLNPTSLEISYAPNEPLTWAIGCIGGDMVTLEDVSTIGDKESNDDGTSTYEDPSPGIDSADAMRSDGVTLDWTNGGDAPGTSLDASAATSLTLSIDSQNREIAEIGTNASDVALGKMKVSISVTCLFEDNAPLVAHLDGVSTTLQIDMTDTPGNLYRFIFPRVTIDQVTLVNPGTDTDVVYELECSALVDPSTNQMTFTATGA